MATIVGGGLNEIPVEKTEQAQQVLTETFEKVTQLSPSINLQSNFASPVLNAFAADLTPPPNTPPPPAPVKVNLLLMTPSGNTVSLTIPEQVVTALEQIVARGTGSFSILSKSVAKPSGLSSLEDAPAGDVHALTLGDASLGVDSLTGGGASVSDSQAAFITASATEWGVSTSTLADISSALKLMSKAGTTAAADLAVEIVRLTLSDDADFDEIGLTYDQQSLVLARLEDLPGATLALSGMEKALVVGAGTVRVDSLGTGSLVVGDSANQVLISGLGNDTLVGGGGMDTLVGGAGADVFGFNKRGHYTITDFVAGVDKAYFEFDGVTTAAQVKSYLTAVTESNGNTTFHFGSDASITLVGVSANAAIGPLLFDI